MAKLKKYNDTPSCTAKPSAARCSIVIFKLPLVKVKYTYEPIRNSRKAELTTTCNTIT